jgi:hypothetical protein
MVTEFENVKKKQVKKRKDCLIKIIPTNGGSCGSDYWRW